MEQSRAERSSGIGEEKCAVKERVQYREENVEEISQKRR